MRTGHPLLLAFVLLAPALLQGCASAPCTTQSCRDDAKITADVKARLKEYRELSAPNSVYVQTRDGVVYLTGQVATDLQRDTAASVAEKVPGVVRVVNSISLTFGAR